MGRALEGVVHVGGTLRASVIDDGRGGANPEGSGLAGLRARVEALDGSMSLHSPQGGGTIVEVSIPCG